MSAHTCHSDEEADAEPKRDQERIHMSSSSACRQAGTPLPSALSRIACISMSATSGRVNSPDGRSPARSISRKSEEHPSELQSLMRISYAVYLLQTKINNYD